MSRALKSYPLPWEGRLILVCKKCQKKMKGHGALAKVKKSIKHRETDGVRLHVLNVPCMNVCPKGGVAVVDPRRAGGGLYVLRGEEDIDLLIEAVLRPSQAAALRPHPVRR